MRAAWRRGCYGVAMTLRCLQEQKLLEFDAVLVLVVCCGCAPSCGCNERCWRKEGGKVDNMGIWPRDCRERMPLLALLRVMLSRLALVLTVLALTLVMMALFVVVFIANIWRGFGGGGVDLIGVCVGGGADVGRGVGVGVVSRGTLTTKASCTILCCCILIF